MRVIYTANQEHIVLEEKNIKLNGKNFGHFNEINAIILGKESPLLLDFAKTPYINYPKCLIDELIPMGFIAIRTNTEVVKYNIINKALLQTVNKEGVEYYTIPREEMTYAKIKGINA